MELKKVALDSVHRALGAKMVEFAGYEMPVRYSSDKEEHLRVREKVGIFDVSHMGEFMIKGEHALDLLQKVVSNDVSRLHNGKAMYAYLPNDQGGVVDDLLVYRLEEDSYMLVVNASNIEKDWEWISRHNTMGAEMRNVSDEISLFAVQGPLAQEALQTLSPVDLSTIKFYNFVIGPFAGYEEIIISATGYTGAGGFELYVPREASEKIWNAILQAGASHDILPIGLGARDTLRLEKGYCLYGNDLNDTSCPIEAGLGWVTKFNKEFINSENLKIRKENGVPRRLIGFKMLDKGIPRAHYAILNESGETIGEVSSGGISPSLNMGIGMAYLPKEMAKEGTLIQIQIRNRVLKAEVVKMPFV